MINFFRKLRQNMLAENKVSRYLLYAIGEILLVVIGILIALQINTWNENRKSRIQELNLLESFQTGLQADLNYRMESIETYENSRHAMDYLIGHLENDRPYTDSLKFYFSSMVSDWGFRFDFSSYEELKSKGTALISNQSLRTNLIAYYSHAEGPVTFYARRYSNIIDEASRNIFPRHFDEMWNGRWENGDITGGRMNPLDYEVLKKDKEFLFFLKTLRNQNHWLIDNTTRIIDANYAAIESELADEIARLKK